MRWLTSTLLAANFLVLAVFITSMRYEVRFGRYSFSCWLVSGNLIIDYPSFARAPKEYFDCYDRMTDPFFMWPKISTNTNIHIGLPLWFLFLLTNLMWPLTPWVRRRFLKRRRKRLGLCPVCGYSMQGNTSGRCPECGNEPHSEAEAPA